MGKNSRVPRTAPAPVIEVPKRERMHECGICKEQVSRRQSIEIITEEGIKIRVCRTHDIPIINCITTRAGGLLKKGSRIKHVEDVPVMSLIHKDGNKKTFRAKYEDGEWTVSETKGPVCMCFLKIPEGCVLFEVTGLAKNGKSLFVKPVKEVL